MSENFKSTRTPQKRQRRPYTPESTQTRILAKAIAGESNSEIARQEGLDRGTIRRILSRSEFQNIIQEHRQQVLELIPDSIRLFRKALKTSLGDESLPAEPVGAEKIAVLDGEELKRMLDAAFKRGAASALDGMRAASETLKGLQVLVGKQEADLTIQDEARQLSDEERRARISAYLARLGKRE